MSEPIIVGSKTIVINQTSGRVTASVCQKDQPCRDTVLANFSGPKGEALARETAESVYEAIDAGKIFRGSIGVEDGDTVVLGLNWALDLDLLDLSDAEFNAEQNKAIISAFLYGLWSSGILPTEEAAAEQQAAVLSRQIKWRWFPSIHLQSLLDLSSVLAQTGRYDKAVAKAREIISYPNMITSSRPLYADEAAFLISDIRSTQAMLSRQSSYLYDALVVLKENEARLESWEHGYKRRYNFEMLKTCRIFQEHFSQAPADCAPGLVAAYANNATEVYNRFEPLYSDNFIAVRTFLETARLKMAAGDLKGAGDQYDRALGLVNFIKGDRRWLDGLEVWVRRHWPRVTAPDQFDAKAFLLFEAQARRGKAEIERKLADSGDNRKERANHLSKVLTSLEQAIAVAKKFKAQAGYNFFKGSMFEEQQIYYGALIDYAEAALESRYVSGGSSSLAPIREAAAAVGQYYEDRARLSGTEPTDINYLKSQLITAEIYLAENQHLNKAATAYRRIAELIAAKEKTTADLPPYFQFLRGKALIRLASLQADIDRPQKEIFDLLTAGAAALALASVGSDSFLETIAMLRAEGQAVKGKFYLRQTYLTDDLTSLARADEALDRIPLKYFDQRVKAEVKSADVLITRQFIPPELAELAILRLADARQAADLPVYLQAEAALLQGKLYASQSKPKLAFQVLDEVPQAIEYYAAAAFVEQQSLIARYPDVFSIDKADLAGLADAAAYADKSKNNYLLAYAAVTKGELLMQKAEKENDKEKAKKLLAEANQALLTAQAHLPKGDYLHSKAGILSVIILLRGPEKLSAESTRQALAALQEYKDEQGSDSYLWSLSNLVEGQTLIALGDYGLAEVALAQVANRFDYIFAQAELERIGLILRQTKHMRLLARNRISVNLSELNELIRNCRKALTRLNANGTDTAGLELQLDLYRLAIQMSDKALRAAISISQINALAERVAKLPEPSQTILSFELRLKGAALFAEQMDYEEVEARLAKAEKLFSEVEALGKKHDWDTSYLEADLYFLAALLYRHKSRFASSASQKAHYNAKTREYVQKVLAVAGRSTSSYTKNFLPAILKSALSKQ